MTLIDKADDRTPERRRMDAWSAENPRDQMALVAVAAWLNTTPDKLPAEMRLHTCAATKEAWARVVDAISALPARGVDDLPPTNFKTALAFSEKDPGMRVVPYEDYEFVLAQIAALRAERDRYLRHLTAGAESLNAYKARADAAETTAEKLRGALEHEVRRSRRHLAASTLAALATGADND